MDDKLARELSQRLIDYDSPHRIAISSKYPVLKRPIIFLRRLLRKIKDSLNRQINYQRSDKFLPSVVARHQSVLRRRLGNSDQRLQEQKIINLRQAIKQLNGVIIQPGHIFSLWQILGQPTRQKGYVDGMLLANGQIIEGLGGGLCQLSNFLYWIFLHSPFEIIERYHHSRDVFPDSGRVLPFGSGATTLYNFVDLKARNISNQPLQIKLWLTDSQLKGQILTTQALAQKFHIFEQDHCFIKRQNQYFRYNKIYRDILVAGQLEKTELVAINFAPVLYQVSDDYLLKNNFTVFDFSSR